MLLIIRHILTTKCERVTLGIEKDYVTDGTVVSARIVVAGGAFPGDFATDILGPITVTSRILR